MDSCIIGICLVVRVASCILVRTSFYPDEFWQSMEVAHRMVFGVTACSDLDARHIHGGKQDLNLSKSGFARYQVQRVLRLDVQWMVRLGPRVAQSLLVVYADAEVYTGTAILFGSHAARWALVCQLASWFNFYCMTRTYSNSLEACFTVISLRHWASVSPSLYPTSRNLPIPLRPSKDEACIQKTYNAADGDGAVHPQRQVTRLSGNQRLQEDSGWGHLVCAVMAATAAVLLRPTSVAFWLPVGVTSLLLIRPSPAFGDVGSRSPNAGEGHKWIVTAWRFFKFNIIEGGSGLYGREPWHWNFTVGFPAMTASYLPLGLVGIILANGSGRGPALLVVWYLALHSLPSHKEFRFLLPALPLLMPYAGLALSRASHFLTIASRPLSAAKNHRNQAVSIRSHASHAPPKGLDPPAGASDPNSPPHSPSFHEHLPLPQSPYSHDGQGRAQSYDKRLPCCVQQTPTRRWPCLASRERMGSRQNLAGFRALLCLVFVPQLLLAAYFSLLHQRGTMAAMEYLAAEALQHPNMSILFVTPCHALPYYSHVHRPISMDFFDCSPPGYRYATMQLNAQTAVCQPHTSSKLYPSHGDVPGDKTRSIKGSGGRTQVEVSLTQVEDHVQPQADCQGVPDGASVPHAPWIATWQHRVVHESVKHGKETCAGGSPHRAQDTERSATSDTSDEAYVREEDDRRKASGPEGDGWRLRGIARSQPRVVIEACPSSKACLSWEQREEEQLSERAAFEAEPVRRLRERLAKLAEAGCSVTHVVLFDSQRAVLEGTLQEFGFSQREQFWHAVKGAEMDERYVLIYAAS
eukprot:jgi/Botrbrau1/17765/Bobra.0127s0022.1